MSLFQYLFLCLKWEPSLPEHGSVVTDPERTTVLLPQLSLITVVFLREGVWNSMNAGGEDVQTIASLLLMSTNLDKHVFQLHHKCVDHEVTKSMVKELRL